MSSKIEIRCCICREIVSSSDDDWYSMQVTKTGKGSPEMVWTHGACLRKVIPVIGEKIPLSENLQ